MQKPLWMNDLFSSTNQKRKRGRAIKDEKKLGKYNNPMQCIDFV